MRKKGETGVDDRSKPGPEKKKERDDKRKKKKSARLERQQARRQTRCEVLQNMKTNACPHSVSNTQINTPNITLMGALTKNKKTEKQILLLIQKFELLEKQHKTTGLTPYTIPTLESSFDQIFRSILTLEVAKKELNGKKKGE